MWSNRDKSHAIRQLVINLGDITLTSKQTGVPERTLQRWKNDLQTTDDMIHWSLDTREQRIRERYDGIRVTMLEQIERLLSQMTYVSPREAPDYALAVARLTDRIEKIESILDMAGQYIISVEVARSMDDATDRLAAPGPDDAVSHHDHDTTST